MRKADEGAANAALSFSMYKYNFRMSVFIVPTTCIVLIKPTVRFPFLFRFENETGVIVEAIRPTVRASVRTFSHYPN